MTDQLQQIHQIQLFQASVMTNKPVNVASVAQRSPFRYPGGKTWFVPFAVAWLSRMEDRPRWYVEPFAGGAIVGLTVAFEHLADHVILVEMDERVAAVWETIITAGEGKWLANQIEQFQLTADNVNHVLSQASTTTRERAFQTILQNRTAHGGILAPGAGMIKNGEAGRGIASRWYPQTLARRIRDIDTIRDRFTFIQGDAFPIIEAHSQPDVVMFVDPPYTAGNGKRAGSRLYTHFEIDHDRLFALMADTAADFLMTYDNDSYVVGMAEKHGLVHRPIAMQNTHLAKMTELVISRD